MVLGKLTTASSRGAVTSSLVLVTIRLRTSLEAPETNEGCEAWLSTLTDTRMSPCEITTLEMRTEPPATTVPDRSLTTTLAGMSGLMLTFSTREISR